MQTPLTLRRWQRAEYDRLVDLGVFQGEPIELIGGQLVVAEPQGSYHASAITKVDYALRAIVPPGWIVRLQAPVSLDDESEPEPDLVVVPGRPGDYRARASGAAGARGRGGGIEPRASIAPARAVSTRARPSRTTGS